MQFVIFLDKDSIVSVVKTHHVAPQHSTLSHMFDTGDFFYLLFEDEERDIAVAADFQHFEVKVDNKKFLLETIDQL